MHVRMSYLRNAHDMPEWSQEEMASIVDLFKGWLPYNVDAAREAAAGWWHLTGAEILRLRHIKTYLLLMEPGLGYIAGARAERMRDWLDLRTRLP